MLRLALTLFGLVVVAITVATLVRVVLIRRARAGRAPRNRLLIAVVAGPGMLLALVLALRLLGITHAPQSPADIAKAAMSSSPCSSDTPRSGHFYSYYHGRAWDEFIALGLCRQPLTPQTPPSRLVVTQFQILSSDRNQAEIVGTLYLGDREIHNFHIHMTCVGGGRGGCQWGIGGWS